MEQFVVEKNHTPVTKLFSSLAQAKKTFKKLQEKDPESIYKVVQKKEVYSNQDSSREYVADQFNSLYKEKLLPLVKEKPF